MNTGILLGTRSAKGVEVRYLDSGTPCASFVLELPEAGQDGKTDKQLAFCEVYGKKAEAASEMAPGTVCGFEGTRKRLKRGEHWETVITGFELVALAPAPVAATVGRA
jgi:hypothetical protein